MTKEDKFNDSVKMINHFTDLQIFIDEHRSRTNENYLFEKVNVQLFEPNMPLFGPNSAEGEKQTPEENDLKKLDLPTQEEVDKNVKHVKNKIKNMIKEQSKLTMEDKADLLSMLHQKEVNYRVTEDLKTITDVGEYHVLHDLSELVNYMITESINDRHNDFKIVNNILSNSSTIYCRKSPDGMTQLKKTYLADLIKGHAIWTEINRWKTWIYQVIDEKRKESLAKKKKQIVEKYRKMKEESSADDNDKTMFAYLFSKVTKPLATLEIDYEKRLAIENLEEENGDNKTNLNIIFNVLSSYVHYLSLFGVKLDISKDILLYFCERYELDKDRTQLLLSELESTYSKGGFTEEEQVKIENEKTKRLNQSFDDDQMIISLYHISKYVNNDSTLMKILKLNKKTYKCLKETIYRRSLLNVRSHMTPEKREVLWDYFLNLKDILCDYTALRDKINQNPEIIERVEEVITLDVQRSFNNTESISRENLSNILKTYAFYNPEIEY